MFSSRQHYTKGMWSVTCFMAGRENKVGEGLQQTSFLSLFSQARSGFVAVNGWLS